MKRVNTTTDRFNFIDSCVNVVGCWATHTRAESRCRYTICQHLTLTHDKSRNEADLHRVYINLARTVTGAELLEKCVNMRRRRCGLRFVDYFEKNASGGARKWKSQRQRTRNHLSTVFQFILKRDYSETPYKLTPIKQTQNAHSLLEHWRLFHAFSPRWYYSPMVALTTSNTVNFYRNENTFCFAIFL